MVRVTYAVPVRLERGRSVHDAAVRPGPRVNTRAGLPAPAGENREASWQ
jgi:hypothetical protein